MSIVRHPLSCIAAILQSYTLNKGSILQTSRLEASYDKQGVTSRGRSSGEQSLVVEAFADFGD